MATNLGTLTLNLLANTGSYIQGLSRAERQTRNSTKGMADGFDLVGKSLTVLKGVVAGISVASVTSFALEVIRSGNEIDRLAKLANSSVSQFQYYSKGAQTAGISIEKFADQMKDMQDRIGDFQQTGGGPLADFFHNIAPLVGVSIQQFQKLSGPEALQLFYNSLEKVGSTKNDIKFYMESIISDSSELIPLLENNGKLFKEWGDKAKETGAVMSDDLVGSLVEAQKNLQIFDLQWQGLKNGLVADVVPVLRTVIENTDTIKAVAVAAAAAIGTKLVVQAGILAGTFTMAAIRAGVMEATLISLQGASATTATSMGVLRGAVAFLGGPAGLAMLAVQAIAAGSAYYLMTQNTKDANAALDDQSVAVSSLRDEYRKLTAAQLALKGIEASDEIEKQANQLKSFYTALQQLESDFKVQGDVKQYSAIEGYLASLKKGGDEAKNAFAQLQQQGLVSDSTLKFVAELDTKITSANKAIDRQREIQALLKNVNDDVTRSREKENRVLDASINKYQLLTKAQRDYVLQAGKDASREKYIKGLIAGGFTVDKANAYAEAQSTNGENAYKVPLANDVRKAAEDNFKRKNYTFGKDDLAAIAKVQGIAKANNFAKIEGLYGLPAGTLAAYVLGESGGDENAKSPTGATGLFQTTSIFRRNYREILSKGNNSVEAQATAIADAISLGLKEFGSMDKALMSINAGITGTHRYIDGNIGTGKGQMSPKKAKEVAGYYPKFAKYFSAVNGKSTVDESMLQPTQSDLLGLIDQAAEAKKALEDTQKEVNESYFTEPKKLEQEHKDRVEKAIMSFGGTPKLKEILAQEDALYAAQKAKLTSDTKDQYNQYFSFETDRIKQIEQNYARQEELINSNAEYNYGKSKEALEIKAALDRQKEQEIAWEKLEQAQRLSDASAFLRTEIENIQVRYAYEREQILLNSQLSKDEQQQRIALSKAQEQLALLDQASQASGEWDATYADMNGTGQQYQLEQQRNGRASQSLKLAGAQDALAQTAAEREAVWKAHTERMLMIDRQYELDKASLGTKAAADTLSGMTDLMGSLLGEQSAGYKAMFAMSKAFAIAQAIINAPRTFSDVYASVAAIPYVGPYIAPVMAGAAVAVQLAQVAQIKSTNLTGMAHDGIDYVPQEGTWLLNKGERVLSPRQNQDFTRAMSEKRFQSQVSITVNNNTDAVIKTRSDANGGITIDVVRNEVANAFTRMGTQANSHESQMVQQGFIVERNRG
ncbi:TPA: transglycosylase SLT domain-containing protein [Acinetobacter nosocomialis]